MKVAGIDVRKKVLMVVVVDASALEEKPARRRWSRRPSTGGRSGWNWNPTCVCTWRRRFPTVWVQA